MRRRIHVCHMRRRIHVSHMRRRIHVCRMSICEMRFRRGFLQACRILRSLPHASAKDRMQREREREREREKFIDNQIDD
jgi:hypothetical protein